MQCLMLTTALIGVCLPILAESQACIGPYCADDDSASEISLLQTQLTPQVHHIRQELAPVDLDALIAAVLHDHAGQPALMFLHEDSKDDRSNASKQVDSKDDRSNASKQVDSKDDRSNASKQVPYEYDPEDPEIEHHAVKVPFQTEQQDANFLGSERRLEDALKGQAGTGPLSTNDRSSIDANQVPFPETQTPAPGAQTENIYSGVFDFWRHVSEGAFAPVPEGHPLHKSMVAIREHDAENIHLTSSEIRSQEDTCSWCTAVFEAQFSRVIAPVCQVLMGFGCLGCGSADMTKMNNFLAFMMAMTDLRGCGPHACSQGHSIVCGTEKELLENSHRPFVTELAAAAEQGESLIKVQRVEGLARGDNIIIKGYDGTRREDHVILNVADTLSPPEITLKYSLGKKHDMGLISKKPRSAEGWEPLDR